MKTHAAAEGRTLYNERADERVTVRPLERADDMEALLDDSSEDGDDEVSVDDGDMEATLNDDVPPSLGPEEIMERLASLYVESGADLSPPRLQLQSQDAAVQLQCAARQWIARRVLKSRSSVAVRPPLAHVVPLVDYDSESGSGSDTNGSDIGGSNDPLGSATWPLNHCPRLPTLAHAAHACMRPCPKPQHCP